jgi:hypothetical protein
VFGVVGLIALQIVIAAIFYFTVLLLSFNSDSCYGSGTCDYGMAGVSLYLVPVVAVLTVLTSVVFTIVLRRRDGSTFLSSVVGIIAVIVAGVAAIVLNLNALT